MLSQGDVLPRLGHPLLRILVIGVCGYAGLIFLLRLAGKRALSKMNAFDLVVTVALGSTFATLLLSKDVALAEGLAALALLCALQFVVAFLSVRWPGFERLVKAEPALLFFQGRFLHRAMKHERVTTEELRSAARAAGHADFGAVAAVVLETDGSFSVVAEESRGGASTLATVGVPSDEKNGAG